MPGCFGSDKIPNVPALGPEQGAVALLQGKQGDGQGIGRYVGPDLETLLIQGGISPVLAGGKIENFRVSNTGNKLLGAPGKPAPWLGRQADDLLQEKASMW